MIDKILQISYTNVAQDDCNYIHTFAHFYAISIPDHIVQYHMRAHCNASLTLQVPVPYVV